MGEKGPTKDFRSLLGGVKSCWKRVQCERVVHRSTHDGETTSRNTCSSARDVQSFSFSPSSIHRPASSRPVARRVRRRRWHTVLSSARETSRARVTGRPSAVARPCSDTWSRLRRSTGSVSRLRLTIGKRRTAALLRVEVRVGRSAVGHRGRAGCASTVGGPAGGEVRHTSAAHTRRVGDLEGVDLRVQTRKRRAQGARRKQAYQGRDVAVDAALEHVALGDDEDGLSMDGCKRLLLAEGEEPARTQYWTPLFSFVLKPRTT